MPPGFYCVYFWLDFFNSTVWHYVKSPTIFMP